MATLSTRNKAGLVTRTNVQARTQSGLPLQRRILAGITSSVATVETAVEGVEADLQRRATAAVREGVFETRGRRTGTTTFEPEGGFAPEEVGRPVVATHAPEGTEGEFGLVSVSGAVVDRRRMRVTWFSVNAAPRRVRFAFIIGV